MDERKSLLTSASGVDGSQAFGSVDNNRRQNGDSIGNGGVEGDMERTYTDRSEHMTLGRRIAGYFSKYSWYHPMQDDERITAAWAYFEHFILPRRHFSSGIKAKPGHNTSETRLYSVWATREVDLAELGVGIGIYFFTLRCLAIVFLLAGLINVPNLMYYNSGA